VGIVLFSGLGTIEFELSVGCWFSSPILSGGKAGLLLRSACSRGDMVRGGGPGLVVVGATGVKGEGGGRLEERVEQVSILFREPLPSRPLDPMVLFRPRDPVLL